MDEVGRWEGRVGRVRTRPWPVWVWRTRTWSDLRPWSGPSDVPCWDGDSEVVAVIRREIPGVYGECTDRKSTTWLVRVTVWKPVLLGKPERTSLDPPEVLRGFEWVSLSDGPCESTRYRNTSDPKVFPRVSLTIVLEQFQHKRNLYLCLVYDDLTIPYLKSIVQCKTTRHWSVPFSSRCTESPGRPVFARRRESRTWPSSNPQILDKKVLIINNTLYVSSVKW